MHLLWMLFLVLLSVQDSWQSHRIKRVPMNTSSIDLDFGLVTEDVCSGPTPKPKKDKFKANLVGIEAAEGEENLQHSAAATPLPKPFIKSDEALDSSHQEGNTAASLTNAVLQEPEAHNADIKKYAKHVAKSSGAGRHHKKKHDHHRAKEEKKRSKLALDEMLTKNLREMLTKVFAKNNAIDGGDNGNAMNDKDNNKHITNMGNLTANDNSDSGGNGNGKANTHRSAPTVNGNGNSNNATTNDGNNNANNQNNAAADATAIIIDVGIKSHNHNKSPAGDGGGVGSGAPLAGAHTSGILTLPLIGKEKSMYEQQLERELERQQQQQQEEEKQQRREGHEPEAPQLGTSNDLQQIPLAKFNPSDGYLQFSKLHLFLDGKPIRAQGGQISINANPFANISPSISMDPADGGGDFDTIDYLFNSDMVPPAPFGAVPRGGIAIGPPSLRAVGYATPGSSINEFPLSRPWHYYQGSGPAMMTAAAAAAPVPPMPSVNFIENALDLLLASKMASNVDDNEATDTEVELLCPLHRDLKRTSPEISGDSGKCTVNGGPSQDGGLVCSCRFIKHKHVP